MLMDWRSSQTLHIRLSGISQTREQKRPGTILRAQQPLTVNILAYFFPEPGKMISLSLFPPNRNSSECLPQ
jgi:hypothetical protein